MENEDLQDERFAHISKDLRFLGVPRHERKVKIDKRFAGMFTEKKFKLKYAMDKRGRPQNYTTNEDLKRFYDLSSSDEEGGDDDEDDDKEEEEREGKARRKTDHVSSSDSSSEGGEEEEVSELPDVDLARGEGNIESSSSDEESSESDEEIEMIHPWGEMDEKAERTEEPTNRLAVCNMFWDRINVKDIYVILNSFTPAGGIIKSIKIYLSDYGRERLAKEDMNGPEELMTLKIDVNDVDEDGNDVDQDDEKDVFGLKFKTSQELEEEERLRMEKIREYEMNRLRHYYAIVECDSVDTANKIYTACDGFEYESSATKMDLRFVPDEMEFDDEPTDAMSSSMDVSQYRPNLFVNNALQLANVTLTWDETNPNRVDAIQHAFDKGYEDNLDLKAYLASSEDDDSDDEERIVKKDKLASSLESDEIDDKNVKEEDSIAKYKALLLDLDKEERKKEDADVMMEITWGAGLMEKTESLVQKKLAAKQEAKTDKTDWEKYLDKRKDKLKEKREHAKKETSKGKKNFDEEEKAFSDDELPWGVDKNDPFFADSGDDTKSKKTSKGKRGKKSDTNEVDTKEKRELELLLMDEDDNKPHFSLRKLMKTSIKKKRAEAELRKNADDFKMDVKDPRFSAVYSSHLYNIDPSELQYKKTEGMEAIIKEKQQRLQTGQRNNDADSYKSSSQAKRWKNGLEGTSSSKTNSQKNDKTELSVLIKSVKSKAANFKTKKTLKQMK